MGSVRHLKVLQDRPADRSPIDASADAPGDGDWRWIALGMALTITLWVALGLLLVDLGPWAVVTALVVAASLGGALVARLSIRRPIRAAAASGVCATSLCITIAVLRGALDGGATLLFAFTVLLVVGGAASALGGKIAVRRRGASS
jgi:hypothetical protein